ncbi:MAG: AIDA repeat-containing protein [Victivallales bacterium]|nr:AIDA repeat-containing protein [Victivallales bacterium]
MSENTIISSGVTSVSLSVSSSEVLTVSSGGTVDKTQILADGKMQVLSGGLATDTVMSGIYDYPDNNVFASAYIENGGCASGISVGSCAFLYVSSGAVISGTTVNGWCARVYASSGASVNGLSLVNQGALFVSKGAHVENVSYRGGGVSLVLTISGGDNETYVHGTNQAGKEFTVRNGVGSNLMLYGNYFAGSVGVINGGVLKDTVVSNGYLNISSGGIASNTTVIGSFNGIRLHSGAVHSGIVNVSYEGGFVVSSGGVVNFSVNERTVDDGVLINNLAFITGAPAYTLTVRGDQGSGVYKLASGAVGFDQDITICTTNGQCYDAISVGGNFCTDNGVCYSLLLDDDTLLLTVSSSGTAPVSSGGEAVFSSGMANVYSSGILVSSVQSAEGQVLGYGYNDLMMVGNGGNAKDTTVSSGGTLTAELEAVMGRVVLSGGTYSGGGVFSSNLALQNGGAVANFAGSAVLSGASFVGNSAVAPESSSYPYGGAVYNSNGTMLLEDVVFSRNSVVSGSLDYGGALCNQGGEVVVSSARFLENYGWDGGAIENHSGKMWLTDVEITGNSGGYGGAIDNTLYTSMYISSALFQNNYAMNHGGVMRNYGYLNVSSATFLNNSGRFGGVLYNNSNAFFENVIFSGNTDTYNGGGAIENYNMIRLGNVQFLNNSASTNGGAVYNASKLNLVGAVFSGNKAGGQGGAIYNLSGGIVNIVGNVLLATENDSICNLGTITINPGATLSTCATISTASGTIINNGRLLWDITGRALSSPVMVDNLANISGGNYTISMAANQNAGKYQIAAGASDFQSSITISVSGIAMGSVGIGNSLNVQDRCYALDVDSNGVLSLDITTTTVDDKDYVKLYSGSTVVSRASYMTGKILPCSSYNSMTVSSGGSVNQTTLLPYGNLLVLSGGVATDTMVDGGGEGAPNTLFRVYNGGSANGVVVSNYGSCMMTSATGNNIVVGARGLVANNRGVVSNVVVEGSAGRIIVYSSGSAEDVDVRSSGYAFASFGGVIQNGHAVSSGIMIAGQGGLLSNVSADVLGRIQLQNGGIGRDIQVASGGYLYAAGSSVLEGTIMVAGVILGSGSVNAENAEIVFALEDRNAENSYILNDISRMEGATYKVSVSEAQAYGVYELAGNAAEFDGSIAVCTSDGVCHDAISVGESYCTPETCYSVSVSETGVLQLGISANTGGGAFNYEVGSWGDNLEDAKEYAKAKGVPILAYYGYSSWCGYCRLLENQVFAASDFKQYAESGSVVLLKNVDIPGISTSGVPDCYILDADGNVLGRRLGFGNGTHDAWMDWFDNYVSLMGDDDLVQLYSSGSLVSSGNVFSGVVLSSGGNDLMTVSSGGRALGTTVDNGGSMTVLGGGSALGTVVNSGGRQRVSSGAILGGTTIVGGNLEIADGKANVAELVFAVNQRISEDGYILNDLSALRGGTMSVRVAATQAHGAYKLAANAWDFNGVVSVCNDDGSICYGSISVSTPLCVGDVCYSLEVSEGGLNVLVSENTGGTSVGSSVLVYSSGTLAGMGDMLSGVRLVSGGNDSMAVSSGGIVSSTHIQGGGTMRVFSGGLATDTVMSGIYGYPSSNVYVSAYIENGGSASGMTLSRCSLLYVSSGAVLSDATVTGWMARVYASSGASVNGLALENQGALFVSKGAHVENVSYRGGGVSLVLTISGGDNETYVQGTNLAGREFTVQNGVGSNLMLYANYFLGSVGVANGGVLKDTVVSKGYLYISSGGIASNTTVTGNGNGVSLLCGGVHSGTVNVSYEGGFKVSSGGVVNFSVNERTVDDEALINNLAFITGSPTYTLTVRADQDFGVYKLAAGASGFNQNITICTTDGECYEPITVGGSFCTDDNVCYSLGLENDLLTLTISGKEIVAPGLVNVYSSGVLVSGADAMEAISLEETYSAEVLSGGSVSSAMVQSGASLAVERGGWLAYAEILSGGSMSAGGAFEYKGIDNGGSLVMNHAVLWNIDNKGDLTLNGRNELRGGLSTSDGRVLNNGTLVFDLAGREPSEGCYLDSLSNVTGGTYSILVSPTQAFGKYALAGAASGFNEAITICHSDDVCYDAITVGESFCTDDACYSLEVDSSGVFSLTIGANEFVDEEAPVLVGAPSVSVYKYDASFAWSAASDNVGVAGYRLKVGEDIYATDKLNLALQGFEPGEYQYQLQAFDASGNGSEWSAVQYFTVEDSTAPYFTVEPVAIVEGYDVTISWQGMDNVGIARVCVRFDGNLHNASETELTLADLAPGSYEYQVMLWDAAGNMALSQKATVDVKDVTPPGKPVISYVNPTVLTNRNVIIGATFDDDAAVRQYRLNEGMWLNYTNRLVISGNSTVSFRGIDEAGNVSEVASYTIDNIDKTAPAISVSETMHGEAVTLLVAFSDANGIAKRQYLLSGAEEWMDYVSPIEITENGLVLLYAKDNAGNETYAQYEITSIVPAKVDLVVGSPRFVKLGGGNSLSSVDAIGMSFTVFNAGNADIEQTSVDIYVDNLLMGSIEVGNLQAGKGRALSFELEPLSAGEHLVRIVGDASNLLAESNEGNNEVEQTLRINPAVYPIDRFDLGGDNGTFASATDLTDVMLGKSTLESLSIHDNEDVDFYRFALVGRGTTANELGISFNQAFGNLDLALLDANGSVLAKSETATGKETVSLNGYGAGIYYLKVYGYEGASNNYSLTWELPVNAYSMDAFEPNDTLFTAAEIVSNLTYAASIHNGSDLDFYSFQLERLGRDNDNLVLERSIGAGKLNVSILDEQGNVIRENSTDDAGTATLSLSALGLGTYYLKVAGDETEYHFNLAISSVHGDIYDGGNGNDTFASATSLGILSGRGSIEGLSIHVSDDVDMFEFILSEDASAIDGIGISHVASAGDLDLYLYDASGNFIDKAYTLSDDETIGLGGLKAGRYYLKVSGYNGSTNNYTLNYKVMAHSIVADDYEGREPIVIRQSQTIDNMSISPSDGTADTVDTFKLVLDAKGTAASRILLSDYREDWNGLAWSISGNGVNASGIGSEISLKNFSAGEYTLTLNAPVDRQYSEYSLTAVLPEEEMSDSWSVFIYIDGDNNLEAYYFWELYYMQNARLADNVNVYVMFDRTPEVTNNEDTYRQNFSLGDWSDTRVAKLTYNSGYSITLDWESWGELDMGSANTLERFIAWGKEQAPADNYAVILKDHGTSFGYICEDDTNGDTMLTIDAIAQVVSNHDISVTVFDACLMASDLVLSAMSGATDYVVASEAIGWTPNWTVQYEQLLNSIRADMTPGEFAAAVVAANYGTTQYKSTLGAFDTSDEAIYAALCDFGNASSSFTSADWTALVHAFANVANYNSGNVAYFSDLGQILGNIDQSSASLSLKTAIADLAGSVGEATIAFHAMPTTYGNGFSVFNPLLSASNMKYYRYGKGYYLDYYNSKVGQSSWGTFLKQLEIFSRNVDYASSPVTLDTVTWGNGKTAADLGVYSGNGCVYDQLAIASENDINYFTLQLLEDGKAGDYIVLKGQEGVNMSISIEAELVPLSALEIENTTFIDASAIFSLEGWQAGTYLLSVSADRATNYSMNFVSTWGNGIDYFDYASANDDANKATSLNTGYYTGLMASSSDRDWFSFNGNIGNDNLRISIEGENLVVMKLDGEGNLTELSRNEETGTYDFTLSSSEHIQVVGTHEDIAAYSMSVMAVEEMGDVEAPVIELSGNTTDPLQASTLEATTEEGLKLYYNMVSAEYDGDWTEYNGEISVTANATYYFKATDEAGNVGTNSIVFANIDTEAPVIADMTVAVSGGNGMIAISIAASETLSKLSYSWNGGEWNEAEGALVLVEQNGIIRFHLVDLAGNETTTTEIAIDAFNVTLTDIQCQAFENGSAILDWSGDATAQWSRSYDVALLSGNDVIELNGLAAVGLEFLNAPAGDIAACVKPSQSEVWTNVDDGLQIQNFSDENSMSFIGGDNGMAELMFARGTGVWSCDYYARHVGVGEWKGTGQTVLLAGKNVLDDIFVGSDDASILLLTDDENGDALFVDDIYSAFPDGMDVQARFARIDEIRAGAGDDIVDMTSQRFEYIGEGVTVRGGLGNDVIWANNGDNCLYGDAGDDRIVGASGNDIIVGGTGNDVLLGAGGEDIFVFGDEWGQDVVDQLASGKVTLWFSEGDEAKWNAETLTYTDGNNTVQVSGVSSDDILLRFGNDGSNEYSRLMANGAFSLNSSERVFEDKNNVILAG